MKTLNITSKFFSTFALASILFLCGCAGTKSTIGKNGAAKMFPMNEKTADKIIGTAIASEFAGRPVSRVEFPNKGYSATIRFALDSHTIIATMIPATGRTLDGAIVKGFAFEVSHSGTMPITGGNRTGKLFERIVHDASLVAAPVPLVAFGE